MEFECNNGVGGCVTISGVWVWDVVAVAVESVDGEDVDGAAGAGASAGVVAVVVVAVVVVAVVVVAVVDIDNEEGPFFIGLLLLGSAAVARARYLGPVNQVCCKT